MENGKQFSVSKRILRILAPYLDLLLIMNAKCFNRWESSGTQRTKGWKPYGTPLVSPIPCDFTMRRGDAQSIVRTMLSPLLKTGTKRQRDALEDGIAVPEEPSLDASEACQDSHISLMSKDRNYSRGDVLPKLPLQLVDENNACIDLTVGEEKAIKISSTSSSLLVFMNWSKKLLDNYDTHYLENLPEVCKNGPPAKKSRSEPLSLYSCLEAFLREEPLVPEDMWNCPQCKQQRQASKKLDLWRLPKVLAIHLKRFSYSRSMKHKLETFVNFPVHDLDLTNYIANKNNSEHQLYELYALINHYGGMGSGHYTANIKILEENRWYNFDDTHISPMNEEDVKSSAAYVLFYRRVRRDNASLSNGCS